MDTSVKARLCACPQADSGAPAWKAYVDYAAGIVVNGLSQCVIASTDQLLSQARTCRLSQVCFIARGVPVLNLVLQLFVGSNQEEAHA